VTKHRKIALILHAANGLLFLVLGFTLFVLAQAFTSCTTSAIAQSPSPCVYASLVCFGVPIVIALLPIIALTTFGRRRDAFCGVIPSLSLCCSSPSAPQSAFTPYNCYGQQPLLDRQLWTERARFRLIVCMYLLLAEMKRGQAGDNSLTNAWLTWRCRVPDTMRKFTPR